MENYINPEYRHDFVLLFDVQDGNPNGDPDAGNLPRVDPETMQGLVTDVCLKRKVRNWIDTSKGSEGPYKIYVEHHGVLNEQHERAYKALDLESTGSKQDRETIDKARAWMCKNFYDVRIFGAVMTTGVNCGQVQGPIQMTFARSIDPVSPMDMTITRVAVTRSEDAEGSDEGGGKVTEMGRKALIPYGLYRGHGFFNPKLAEVSGVSSQDLRLFWEALREMWELDRSASRGFMACRGLYVFTHKDPLGKEAAHKLFNLINVRKRDNVETPRSYNDYNLTIDDSEIPEGIKLKKLVG